MKILCFSIFLLSAFAISAQGAFKKSSKDNDYLVVVNDGIQFNVGVSYLIPSKELTKIYLPSHGQEKISLSLGINNESPEYFVLVKLHSME